RDVLACAALRIAGGGGDRRRRVGAHLRRAHACACSAIAVSRLMPLSHLLAFLVRVLVGARGAWIGCAPAPGLRIYYANHTSHLDTLALWSALPGPLRARTRPVAAQDYWNRAGLRKYLATHAFNALFIDRSADNRHRDPLAPLAEARARGGATPCRDLSRAASFIWQNARRRRSSSRSTSRTSTAACPRVRCCRYR